MMSVHGYVWLALAFVCVAAMLRWYFVWKSHARKFAQSGYTAPYTTVWGRTFFRFSTWVLTILTVGRVKVINRQKSPLSGRTLYIANHQMPCDFAMLRRGTNRHFRTLTSGKELSGFFGVLGAWTGAISIGFKEKSERAAAQATCVDVVAQENGSLGIFPEGNLLPDNPRLTERWLPGAVRIARLASEKAGGAKVNIVPIALYYERDPSKASWIQRFFARAAWLGLRNPRNWDPIFKLDLDQLSEDERTRVEAEREQKLKAYYHSHVTLYGGAVVVGDPIDMSTLPADEDQASLFLRDRVLELLEIAEQNR